MAAGFVVRKNRYFDSVFLMGVNKRLSQLVGVRQTAKSHAEFGDDRDAFASTDASFRGAERKDKKPAPSGAPADEDDKPRGI